MIPGGELSGAIKPAPDVWDSVPDTIQVEFRPSDPYSINIWGVGIDQDLFIATGSDGTTWSEFLDVDANVRVRTQGDLYLLTAVEVFDEPERSNVVTAYLKKYDVDREEGWVKTGMIFRLDRRESNL